jgi:hypothetical protein
MDQQTRTPCIEVAIGREMRLYHAFVTTAPTKLDAPATLTLYAAPLSDVSGMAADPMVLDTVRGREPARFVLVSSNELAWQRTRSRQFIVHGDRKNFALLRAINDPSAQNHIRSLLLHANETRVH